MFDPEKVERTIWRWERGQYRVNRPNIDRMDTVPAEDYDQLLALYRKAEEALLDAKLHEDSTSS